MLQAWSPHRGVNVQQDPGVRIVVDGQIRGWVPDFIEDAWDSVTDTAGDVYESMKGLPDAVKRIGQAACNTIVDDDLRKYITYLTTSCAVPGPQQAALCATLATYQGIAKGCNVALPPAAPPPPGSPTTPGTTSSGTSLPWEIFGMKLQMEQAQQQAKIPQVPPKSLVSSNLVAPWYKRGSTYALLGGLGLAIGVAAYAARR